MARLGFRHGLVMAIAVAAMIGCSSDDKDKYVEEPVDVLYNKAIRKMNEEDYKKAAKDFDEVERQHPYSTMGDQGADHGGLRVLSGATNTTTRSPTLDRFIELHPASPDVPYAYYLRRPQLLRADLRRRPRSGDDRKSASGRWRI